MEKNDDYLFVEALLRRYSMPTNRIVPYLKVLNIPDELVPNPQYQFNEILPDGCILFMRVDFATDTAGGVIVTEGTFNFTTPQTILAELTNVPGFFATYLPPFGKFAPTFPTPLIPCLAYVVMGNTVSATPKYAQYKIQGWLANVL